MKRNFKITIMILLSIIVFLFCFLIYFYNQDFYSKFKKINFSKVLTQKENEYYVYFYQKDCVYCINLQDSIYKFEQENTVFFVDMTLERNKYGFYDAQKFHSENDVEIGKLDSLGHIEFYEGESEQKYLKNIADNTIEYEIVIADENYILVNPIAKIGYIYAKNCSPQIVKNLKQISDFRIVGTPTLIHVKQGKIVEAWEGKLESILER